MIKLLSHIKKIPIVHGHTCPTICVGVTVRRSSGFQVATRSVTAPLCWLLLPSVHLNDCVWSVWELQLGFQSPLGALQFMFFMHRPAMTLSTANCTYSMFINDIQIVFFQECVADLKDASESRKSPSQPSVRTRSTSRCVRAGRRDETSPSGPCHGPKQEWLSYTSLRRLQVLHTITCQQQEKGVFSYWVYYHADKNGG